VGVAPTLASVGTQREAIARVYRRAAFGLAPGELDELEAVGVDGVIDRLVEPEAHGIPAGPEDLFADLVLPIFDSTGSSILAATRWMDHLLVAARPFEEWMGWYWHGHLVLSAAEVPLTRLVANHITLLRGHSLGSFPALLRAVSVDAGMLRYLNGDESSGDSPNENYSRELLELFALGFGHFFESDVQAGAKALTGWRVDLMPTQDDEHFAPSVRFDPSAHDDAPQEYLGRSGVHDLDTVIDAVVAHEACTPFVAARFGRAVLGPEADEALLADLGDRFRDADLDLRVLARGVLEAVAEDRTADLVLGPVAWLLQAQRATGAVLQSEDRFWNLFHAGQTPLWPPNVGGWPGGSGWLTSAATLRRFNMAGTVAMASPEDNPARQAAAEGDLDALADALGRPEGFSDPTRDALADLSRADGGIGVLTAALASPDMVRA
jgi:uncharacterized protein (DUF1800 family)